ncbi:MAG: molybdopterin-dependent oxidoreductase, partial [Bacteroidetes bacterium]|nr:molybdopterin-dependent oxidoreductase [Bacteroidota bacterium]
MCGVVLAIKDGQIQSVQGDSQDVHSKGHICPKALALKDLHEDPDRLRTPVRRVGNHWEPISWEAAFDEIETRIRTIWKEHGRDAVGVYSGNPTVHNTGTLLHLYDFYDALGTRNRFASHSLDQLPLMQVCGELFGHLAMFPVPDLDRTDYLLMLGANPLVSNGSLMSTPGIAGRLRSLRGRGGKLVVVDPMHTKTAAMADEHLFIIPGTDIYLLLAMIHVLVRDGLCKPDRLAAFSTGLDQIMQASVEWSPEWAAAKCGISAADISRLANEFAQAKTAVAYGRLGVSVQQHGTLCQWALVVLNLITGNLDRPGGSLFAKPALDFLTLMASESKFGRWKSRVRQLPETGGDFPAAALADEILEPGTGRIRALFTIAGNPARSVPNSEKLEKALEHLEFMVAIDFYRNETTRHAHLILPPLTGAEVLHYGLALYIVAPQQSAKYSQPAFERSPDTRYDHEILRELQRRLARQSVRHQILSRIGPETRLDIALRTGPYGVWRGRLAKNNGLSLKKLKRTPHGIALGELAQQLPQRLFTPDKKIHAFPASIQNGLVGLMKTPEKPRSTFLLIGRRNLRSNNSWMHNLPVLTGGKDTCTALIHPEDAKQLAVSSGEMLEITSSTGKLIVSAELSANVRRGVISIPHGWGHSPQPLLHLEHAQKKAGQNANTLTDDSIIDQLCGNAVFNGVPIQVKRL